MNNRTRFVAVAVLLAASESMACAVCGGPLSPRTLNAYVIMTVVLSFFPLVLLGTGLWFFLKRRAPG